MTSLAFVLGVLPAGHRRRRRGAGRAERDRRGHVGGVLAGTFLGVLFVPAFFALIVRGRRSTAVPRVWRPAHAA
jgi:multidrug efflux pump subunit AcrB